MDAFLVDRALVRRFTIILSFHYLLILALTAIHKFRNDFPDFVSQLFLQIVAPCAAFWNLFVWSWLLLLVVICEPGSWEAAAELCVTATVRKVLNKDAGRHESITRPAVDCLYVIQKWVWAEIFVGKKVRLKPAVKKCNRTSWCTVEWFRFQFWQMCDGTVWGENRGWSQSTALIFNSCAQRFVTCDTRVPTKAPKKYLSVLDSPENYSLVR